MPSISSLPTLKAPLLSFHSINSSKIPTMLGNSTKPSLADGPKREDEKRKRKLLSRLWSNAYFCLAHALSVSKEKKSWLHSWSQSFSFADFSRGNLGRVRLAIMILFSKIGRELSGDFVPF